MEDGMRIPRAEFFEPRPDPEGDFIRLLVGRLNDLINDEDIKTAVEALIRTRVEFPPGDVAQALLNHDDIQVYSPAEGTAMVGVLGLLNGLAGANEDGSGKVGASYSTDGYLLGFFHHEGGAADE